MSQLGIFLRLIIILLYSNYLFAQVDVVGDRNFNINHDSYEVSLPLFSNMDIYNLSSDVNRVVIVIHGQNRNADDYYNSIYNAAGDTDLLSETLIIAPQFLNTTDMNYWSLNNTVTFWSNTTSWTGGNLSNSTDEHPRDYEISSFAIMDSLVTYLLTHILDLQKIIIVGNSAGGQYVNRYAAGSDQNGQGKIEYVISAPSHYLYFDENRLLDYTYPFVWDAPVGCNQYNDYRYGLQGMNNYMSLAGIDSIRARYSRRKIKYLIGGDDFYGTTDCSSMAQGENRFQRSVIYYNYLQYYFGPQITENQKIAIVPDLAHNHDTIFNSTCGKFAIFESGICEEYDNTMPPESHFSAINSSGNYPLEVSFIDQSVNGTYPIQQLLWNINTQIIGSNSDIQYTFNQPGVYDVELIAIDLVGLSDTLANESMVIVDTLYGDLNWDTEITSSDAGMILEFISGNNGLTELQQSSGDVSKNGELSSLDAGLIYKYLSGQIEELPIIDTDNYFGNGILQSNHIVATESDIITVPINLADPENILSFKISMQYDQNQLLFGTVNANNLFDLGFIVESNFNDGSFIITGAGEDFLNSEVLLFNLYFIVSYGDTEEITISSTDIIFNETRSNQNFSVSISQNLSNDKNPVPDMFTIGNNYPNPFNANTIINYTLSEDDFIQVYVTDIKGKLVKLLHKGIQYKGQRIIEWNGLDGTGNSVPSGIYFYTIKNNKVIKTKKMMLVQ